MTLTIYALDNQFAAATGSNVGSGSGTSTFDYPPNSSKDLVIQSQAGDASPYVFSPGDVYTISFGGNGGDTIQNATVIRSDYIDYGGDTGYAVVFEGLDSKGELIQLVWTPEFDLEGWYWDNFSGGNPPGFYTSDLSATTYQMPCFEQNTLVATPSGPRAVASLIPGDSILTQDHGPQPLHWIGRFEMAGQGRAMPVRIEAGVLGNERPLLLSRQHRVLLHDPDAGEVLVPAAALLNGATVRLQPMERVSYVHLLCIRHEIIRAEGSPCETLLLKRTTAGWLAMGQVAGRAPELGGLAQEPCRPLLTTREGAALWARLCNAGGRKRAMFGRRGAAQAAVFTFVPCTDGPRVNCLRVSAPHGDAGPG
ncbi:Hint domain-containing protein [Rhodobacter maris]|uniref:Hint domain-containing protein n=1 Tax=Rhodobacter maris TaxID=446682 RepID=A0A285RYX3_9RHOB|nr:Hint domain-containing protein [Rhodobacter maris]SOB99435.1 Hint domain-containing protein [Rhodobacter maris]